MIFKELSVLQVSNTTSYEIRLENYTSAMKLVSNYSVDDCIFFIRLWLLVLGIIIIFLYHFKFHNI